MDLVVLVDENDRELGTMPKALVHTDNTPLHRAFSVFLFNDEGEVLVQQRNKNKKTWGGIWSNSCCGHVSPGEKYEAAVERRASQELGAKIQNLEKVANYRYRFERDGIVENEICPVFRATISGELSPDPEEVEAWKWLGWKEWLEILKNDHADEWSPWCKEEVLLLDPPKGLS